MATSITSCGFGQAVNHNWRKKRKKKKKENIIFGRQPLLKTGTVPRQILKEGESAMLHRGGINPSKFSKTALHWVQLLRKMAQQQCTYSL